MALLQVNYLSEQLFRTVPLQVILPTDKLAFTKEGYLNEDGKRYKTLYLLHGLLGNYTDWVSGTRIQRWAQEKNLAVVMPSGDNAFYVNQQIPRNNYEEFIGRELVQMTRRMFPLSDKREDTFIAGLSMGGYGAIRNGLKYSETFGYVAGLSSALHTFEGEKGNISGVSNVYGDLKQASLSDKNPRVALANVIKEKRPMPKFYLACGLDDGLLKSNRIFRDLLIENGVDVTYVEEPGAHEWDFWDRQIKAVLDWLPLEEASQGRNSGNVTKKEEKK